MATNYQTLAELKNYLKKKRDKLKTLSEGPATQIAARQRAAIVVLAAKKVFSSVGGQILFSRIARRAGIPRTRAGGSRFTRLVKYLGAAASTTQTNRLCRHIEHYLSSDLSTADVREKVLADGLKNVDARMKARRKKVRRRFKFARVERRAGGR